jgi:hypothetical protein
VITHVLRWVLVPMLLLIATLALAQQTVPGPACEDQISDLYRTLQADRQVYEVPQGTWSQQLTAIASQLRIVTTQYKMQQQATEQALGQAAMQVEVGRQLQQTLTTLRTALEQAQTRLKELDPAPQAAR